VAINNTNSTTAIRLAILEDRTSCSDGISASV